MDNKKWLEGFLNRAMTPPVQTPMRPEYSDLLKPAQLEMNYIPEKSIIEPVKPRTPQSAQEQKEEQVKEFVDTNVSSEKLLEDPEMRDALERQRQAMMMTGLLRSGVNLAHALAGSKQATDYFQGADELAKMPVESLKTERDSAYSKFKRESELEEAAELKDSTSELSKQFRETTRSMLRMQGLGSVADKIPENASAEFLQKLFPQFTNLINAKMRQDEKRASVVEKPSLFEETKQKELAKAGVEWIQKDRGIFKANLDKTNHAVDLIKKAINKKEPLFGPVRGKVPDAIRALTNPDAIAARDSIHSAIQDTLRPTLGAQFTEKEGERIMKLAVNPELDDKENLRRANELQKVISNKIKFSDDLYSYMDKHGSDKGFPYEKYNMTKAGDVASKEKTITSKQYSPSRNQTRIKYSDGTEEILDGKK